MKDGFLKVACATPRVRVADVDFNTEQICAQIEEAVGKGAKIIVFPELCITGYTCGDLFYQEELLSASRSALRRLTSIQLCGSVAIRSHIGFYSEAAPPQLCGVQ